MTKDVYMICQLYLTHCSIVMIYIDGLVQERRNSIVDALELRLSCTNPSTYGVTKPAGACVTNPKTF